MLYIFSIQFLKSMIFFLLSFNLNATVYRVYVGHVIITRLLRLLSTEIEKDGGVYVGMTPGV